MSILAILDLTLRPESTSEALAVLDDVLVATRGFTGNLGVEVIVQTDDPAHVLVLERWESMEADTAYRAWRASEGRSALAPYVLGLSVTHFDPRG
ncbi:putative quinol monooxygenase [Longivirga aurantiaca]|uniref:Quinol monooxygenase n=1 Tax=Longivirga aurantiaca TaxID=1837743 RepID=A0ABW1SY93_9ACTN